MSALRILALDLSLSSTGVCLPDGSTTRIRTQPVPKNDELAQTERLIGIENEVNGLLLGHRPQLVVLEGFSFSSKNTMAHVTGGLGFIVRSVLVAEHVPWLAIAPSKVKKYATGKGNAPKEQVAVDAVRRFGDLCPSQNDEIDAFVLWAMAHDGTNHPVVQMPAENRKALAGVEWPFNPEVAR